MSSSQSASLNLRERLMMSIWWEVKNALLDAWDKRQSSLTQEQERLVQHEVSLLSGRVMAFRSPLITNVDSVTALRLEVVPHNAHTPRMTCKVVTNWSTEVARRALASIETLSVNLPVSPNGADLFIPNPSGVATSHNPPFSVPPGPPIPESDPDPPESLDTNEPLHRDSLAEGYKDTRKKWEIPLAGFTQAAWDEHRADWRQKISDATKQALYDAIYPQTPENYRTMLFTKIEDSEDPQGERVRILLREWKRHTGGYNHFDVVMNNFRANSRRACYPPPTEGSLHIDYELDDRFQKCTNAGHVDCVVRRVTISARHAPHVSTRSYIHFRSDIFDKFGSEPEGDGVNLGAYRRKQPQGKGATVNKPRSTFQATGLSSDDRVNPSESHDSPLTPSVNPLAPKGSETAGLILPQGAQPAAVREHGPH